MAMGGSSGAQPTLQHVAIGARLEDCCIIQCSIEPAHGIAACIIVAVAWPLVFAFALVPHQV